MKNNILFKFPKALEEGLILSRPNRFVMFLKVGNKEIRAHCPSTGRIGNIIFKNIPCLFSTSGNKKRKTKNTVEAISLDPAGKKNKKWIGINQVKTNEIVEYFIREGKFSKILGRLNKNSFIKREVRLGNSRIDFLIDKIYLEVKTPLNIMSVPNSFPKAEAKFNSFERIIKQFNDLARSITWSHRAVVVMCYFYDAPAFRPPATDKYNAKIKKVATEARSRGLETWQINFKIDEGGVSLIKLFKLNLL
jgi:sugar fermentation stimulation protein A